MTQPAKPNAANMKVPPSGTGLAVTSKAARVLPCVMTNGPPLTLSANGPTAPMLLRKKPANVNWFLSGAATSQYWVPAVSDTGPCGIRASRAQHVDQLTPDGEMFQESTTTPGLPLLSAFSVIETTAGG